MASISAVSMAMPLTSMAQKRPAGSDAFFQTTRLSTSRSAAVAGSKSGVRLQVRASSMKEKAITGLTTAALAAALVVPEFAEAAQPGISPSLKNFLLSIVSGGVVLTVLVGAVIGVANFDPVKRT